MGRKLLGLVISLAFLLTISTVSFAKTETPSPSPTPEIEKVNYELPYPGLLPDNPLYFLKAVRDRIIDLLVSDPVKKAEFNLLSSDKRTSTGYYLIMKDKDEMGVLYISKGNNYMHMAIISANNAGERGKNIINSIEPSIKKHKEVIANVLKDVDKKNRSKLENELKRLSNFETLIISKKN